MNKKHVSKMGKYIGMACLLFVCAMVQSCRDEYFYDDREPDFLGSSIYDYLQEQGNFTYFLKVIDDLGYAEVLRKTGSKTLFVADDEAFMKGIKERWGVESYEGLSYAQKRIILYGAMLDNAYLLEMLSKKQSDGANGEPVPGGILRRATGMSVADLVGVYTNKDIPQANKDWDAFRDDTVYMALDATKTLMLHLVNDYLYMNNISDADLQVLVGDPTANSSDIYIYDKKVVRDKSDVTCKNGYVHQLDGLLIPPSNMAEELRLNHDTAMYRRGVLDSDALAANESTTMLFSRMLDRYSVPVPLDPDDENVQEYYRIYGEDEQVTLFEKRYYTEGSNRGTIGGGFTSYTTFEDSVRNADASLLFDPGWNAYREATANSSSETDMATIFAPSDKAVVDYFTNQDDGKLLIERYAENVADKFGKGLVEAIDSIPVEILQPLMRNLMKVSFVSCVPSKFDLITDDAKDKMGVSLNDVHHTIVANNGVVYVMKRLYSPSAYKSVFAPVMLDANYVVFDDIVQKTKANAYRNYLLSMNNKFSLVVTDDANMVYYSPSEDVKGKADARIAYRFELLPGGTYEVNAYKYNDATYDPNTNRYVLEDKPTTDPTASVIDELKKEILEYNIVIGDMNSKADCESGRKYYMTKGNGMVMVQRGSNGKVTAVAGGRERQHGAWIPVAENDAKEMTNGHTFKLRTSMIQPPTQNVHDVLGRCGERFVELCAESDEKNAVLKKVLGDKYNTEKKRYDIFNSEQNDIVRFFNTYHYTVYVPTDAAVTEAIAQGLPTWESLNEELKVIESTQDAERQKVLTDSLKAGVELLTKFVKYHFQDNAVFVDKPRHSVEIQGEEPRYVVEYTTAASVLNDSTSRFCEVSVKSENYVGKDGSVGEQTIAVRGDFRKKGDKDFGNENVCYVNNTVTEQENVVYNVLTRDIQFNGKTISTSSYAVVHQISDCLKFGGEGGIYDLEKKQFIR